MGLEEVCNNFGLEYKKQHGNISTVCARGQKTLLSRYICRYNKDDEFKGLKGLDLKNKIIEYLGHKI